MSERDPLNQELDNLRKEVQGRREVEAMLRHAAGLRPGDGVSLLQKVVFLKARVEELERKKFHTGKQVFDYYKVVPSTTGEGS